MYYQCLTPLPGQVVVPSDLSELLTKDAGVHATSFELAIPSNDTPPSEKLHQFRMLILSGRKKVRTICGVPFADHFLPPSCVLPPLHTHRAEISPMQMCPLSCLCADMQCALILEI